MKLSIILTVFNKEPFLHRVFNSLLSQENTQDGDYEVIVVNDGSTDGSAAIIEKFANLHSCIQVITQSNQGLSMARNNGVAIAKGEYVWYIDADDSIASDSVVSILEATKTQPDLIPIYAETDGKIAIRNKIPTSVRTGRDILLSQVWSHCAPFYIYRRSFLNDYNLHFLPNIYHEDSELTPRLLWHVRSVVVIPKVLYHVYCDLNSITQIPRLKRAYDNVLIAENHYIFSREHVPELDVSLRQVYDSLISLLLNNALSIICLYNKKEQLKFNELLYKKQFLFQSLCRASSIKYHIEGFFFKIFPNRYVSIYQLMKGRW